MWISLCQALANVLAPRTGIASRMDEHYFDFELLKNNPLLEKDLDSKLLTNKIIIQKLFYVDTYHLNWMEDLITRMKFNNEFDILIDFCSILGPKIQQVEEYNRAPFDTITCVASDPYRSIVRGYSFASIVQKHLQSDRFEHIFTKQKTSIEQNKLLRSDRLVSKLENLELLSSPQVTHKLSTSKHLLLLDDVVTTGRTLLDHAKLLKKSFPNLHITTLCIAGGKI